MRYASGHVGRDSPFGRGRGRGTCAAAELLPVVYEELRKLAARGWHPSADHTLNPTALVHEAYLRLVGGDTRQDWDGRGHFFASATEAMRRILVESARRRGRLRHGGGLRRVDWLEVSWSRPRPMTINFCSSMNP